MGDSVKKQIGANIRKIRISKGLKGPDVERLTEGQISVTRLANYESGEREPDVSTMMVLAKAMGSTVNAVLAGILDESVAHLPRIEGEKLAEILDEIQIYERGNKLEFSNPIRAHIIKKLYSQPGRVDYRAEIADVIELSQVLRRK